jgi:Mg-chelatase subunit ChlD
LVEVIEPSELPPLDELATYAATVLVDVDSQAFSGAQTSALASAVRDLGRGLVTIGGDRSYALGGYLDSELETLLPVVSEITDPKRRRTVAEVLAIDTSGSMAACHCNEGANGIVGGGNRGPFGGVSKTDISRSAAARAIDALSQNDEVGVLAFDTQQEWVIPLGQVPSEEDVLDGLEQLRPSGGTDLSQSLTEAAEALRASKASLRHIVLFSDGFTAVDDMQALARQAGELREEGITVSVIATGEGAASDLEPIAEAGGGRYYPGRDLTQIPQIMMQETIVASRSFVNEGEFLPQVTSASQIVAELTTSPPLFGYLATTARPQATTHLRIGPDADPLLATWQVGLGRSSAWTSDASKRWSAAWADWDGYVDFWSRTVRDVLPVGGDAGVLRARVEGGRLQVLMESTEAWPDGAAAIARVTTPGFESVELALERVDDVTFRGELPIDASGTYAVGAVVEGPGGAIASGSALANQGYAAEYEAGASDAALLGQVSTLTGGRGEITPEDAFTSLGLEPGTRRTRLAPWLLLAAALLWPLAVALSRLALRGDAVAAARAQVGWLRARVARAAPTLPGRERPEAPPPRPRRAREAKPEPAPPATVGRLLDRKRQGSGAGGSTAGSVDEPADTDADGSR